MTSELRIAFLVLLFLSGILFFIRTRGLILANLEFGQILLDFLLVPTLLGTAATFFFIIFQIDPLPLIRNSAYQLSLQQLVSFAEAVPSNLEGNLGVTAVERMDTDGDGFKEWVVYYKYNVRADRGPVQVYIYDNDRGNPPVIFPYALRVPGSDYLSEGRTRLDLADVTTADANGPAGQNLPELMVHGDRELGIFRYRQNSEEWDFPRDAPARYEPIGFFRGSGGVTFDDTSKDVTVTNRDGYGRSQLVVRSVYRLNPATNTYWDQFYSPTEMDRKLTAPAFSTVDFLSGPPEDIFSATYPEIVVLAFYASTCPAGNDSLCTSAAVNWSSRNFLADEALAEFDNNNPAYFGLTAFKNTSRLAVTNVFYYPNLETDPDLSVSGGGRDVVTGEQAQLNIVEISFVADNSAVQTARFKMQLVDGRWKMVRRVPLEELPPLSAPTRINSSTP